MADVYHALGLHMHQPLGNLVALHNSGESWEAKQILWCYDRPTRMLEGYQEVARLHMSFSGTLLKQLEDPGVRQTFRDVVDTEDFLKRYRHSNIEFVGSGLYHPVYPLIPAADWDWQTEWWQGLGRHLLGRETFQGWFQHEVRERTKFCDFPALVTTWTDGENGGWFRTTQIESGFWGFFYRPLLDRYRAGTLGFTPIHISQYLEQRPPHEEVEVHRGAWNTEHHWGADFTQWTGSLLQKKGHDELRRASDYYWQLKKLFDDRHPALDEREEVRHLITRAYDHLLTAETSCNFYWGSRWVHRSFDDLEQVYYLLDTAKAKLDKVA